LAKIGRNDPCPCGSGKKYKHCCINKNIDFSALKREKSARDITMFSEEDDIEEEAVDEEEYEDETTGKSDFRDDGEKGSTDTHKEEDDYADEDEDEDEDDFYEEEFREFMEGPYSFHNKNYLVSEFFNDPLYEFDENEADSIIEDFKEKSTDEIIDLLHEFNIDSSKEKFVEDLKKVRSAKSIFMEWVKKCRQSPLDGDKELFWASVTTLQERLAKSIVTTEEITYEISKALNMIFDREMMGITRSLELWNMLKDFKEPDIFTVTDLNYRIESLISIEEWIYRLFGFMGEVGRHEERIKLAEDIINTFPGEMDYFIMEIHFYIADSLLKAGKKEEGEAIIKKIIEKKSRYGRGYLMLAQAYSEEPFGTLEDLEKAEDIIKIVLDDENKIYFDDDDLFNVLNYIRDKKKKKESENKKREVLK